MFIHMVGDRDTSVAVYLAAAQIGKSTSVFALIGWIAAEAPGAAFWVMANADMARETISERLYPFLEDIESLDNILPQTRNDKTQDLIRFANMRMYVRGANSRAKLQSTPVRWLLLDEVRNYRKGSLEIVLKRTTSMARSKTVYISTAQDEDDVLHRVWYEGTRTFLYWPCPKCGHWQPFRFGRDDSPIYGKARECGGFGWEDNGATRPGGEWNYGEVAKTIFYECENPECRHHLKEESKYCLLAGVRRVDTNPAPTPGHVSLHAWAANVTWIPWAKIVIEFLKAISAARNGDFEPLKVFVRETLGEPWRMRGIKADAQVILARRAPYVRGQKLDIAESARILTVDVQDEAMLLKWVYRQWCKGGASRLLDYGTFTSLEEAREFQIKHGIKDKAVWFDTGHKTVEVYRMCLKYGWMATKGDKGEGYPVSILKGNARMTVVRPYRIRVIDPFIGRSLAGRYTLQLVRFSSALYKDRLYLFIARGMGPVWEIFSDIGKDYITELTNDEVVKENGKRLWIERGVNDFGDCELMQLVAADAAGFTRSEKIVKPPNGSKNAP